MSPTTPQPRRIQFLAFLVLVLLGLAIALPVQTGPPANAQWMALDTPLSSTAGADAVAMVKFAQPAIDTSTPTPTPTETDTPTPTGTPTATPTGTRDLRAFLPLALRQLPPTPTPTSTSSPTPTPTPTSTPPVSQGIYGWVTYYGAPASDIDLFLWFYNGSAWSTPWMTTTDSNGRYVFTGVPSLLPGQRYRVRFGPNTDMTKNYYLNTWWAPVLLTYTNGIPTPGGDFDIANVSLLSPPAAIPPPTVSLPVQFIWLRRQLGGEGYRWRLTGPKPGFTNRWTSGDLGDVDRYMLNALPAGVTPGEVYGWYVEVYTGPDSYGISFYYREVIFSSGAAAQISGERLLEEGAARKEGSGLIPVWERPQP